METCLTKRYFAGMVLLLFVANCHMSPLLPSKEGGKIKGGDQNTEESSHIPAQTHAHAHAQGHAHVPMAKLETAPSADQASAASDHGHLARVQIKVYRGPDDHHHHAPYGYWVKQPADDAPHHH